MGDTVWKNGLAIYTGLAISTTVEMLDVAIYTGLAISTTVE